MKTTRKQLIQKYIDFFKSKNHKHIPSAPLIPANDPTVLFTTAGMHPLVPYLLGQKHPLGNRLVSVQKCIRTGDIDEVGDESHHTFFEMLGNWSLGDYFKEEAIEYSYEFLTNKKWLNIPKEKLSVTCFKGDKDAPKDTESEKIWRDLGIKKISFLPKLDNWWGPAGKTGPCGPDTEMFVNSFEIWNDVFMEYNKTESEKYIPLSQKNVDTGMGVERTISILNELNDDYLTDCFLPIIKEIENLSGKKYGQNKRSMRIIADHIKASVFILAENISPSNTEHGYVLRRLIRRAVRYAKELGIKESLTKLPPSVLEIYQEDYPELKKNKKFIIEELEKEDQRFKATLENGLKLAKKIFDKKTPIEKKKFSALMQDPNKADLIGRMFDKKKRGKKYSLKNPYLSEKEIDQATITGKDSFLLFQSYGFPLEMIDELAIIKGFLVNHHDFRNELNNHQKLSQTSSAGRFKSGLSDNSEKTKKLHTATHLLNESLRKVLGPQVKQKGSNITPERLRFDFNFDRKLTDEEKNKIETLVNEKIKQALPVTSEELSLKEALKSGAQAEFGSKYPNKVTVFSVGNFSKEICTGPHVSNTSEIGKFKITKEESVAAGVRRIKGIVE